MRTARNAAAYAAVKKSPLVPDFIAHDLNNPRLAKRWRAVTAPLPLKIPDSYAAAAQEERKFTKVVAPRISRPRIGFIDFDNSSAQLSEVYPPLVLQVSIVGDGSNPGEGGVTSDLGGFTCAAVTEHQICPVEPVLCDASGRAVCTVYFYPQQVVTFTATPAPGYKFAGWSEPDGGSLCAPASNTTCSLIMTDDTGLFAEFVPASVTVTTNGSGSGRVVSSPAGIDCGSTCTAAFPGSTTFSFGVPFAPSLVTLTATPSAGSTFIGWSGDSGGTPCPLASDPDCLLTVSGDVHLVATFDQSPTVTVVKNGTGTGTVTSSPSGIDCGPTCTAPFSADSVVTLTAAPDPGSTFAGWTGCDAATGTTCDLDFVHGRTVVATFQPATTITRFAGDGTRCQTRPNCGDGGAPTSAQLSVPGGVAFDPGGNVYIADTGDNEVRKVGTDGKISTVAGNGVPCTTPPNCGDGNPATQAQLDGPTSVAVDQAGNLYIADFYDEEIRKVSTDGKISTVAGDGSICTNRPTCGDGGPATSAQLDGPSGVALDANGNLYIADTFDNEVREVAASGNEITTVAGNGTACTTYPSCGDTGPATSAELDGPSGVALDPNGNLYIADTFDNEVREVANGTINRIAGNGQRCTTAPDCGDGNPATAAKLNGPAAVAVSAGNVYIADSGDDEVRQLTQANTLSLFAGNGSSCSTAPNCGDMGPAPSAELNAPRGVAVTSGGDVLIADTGDHEVRRVH